MKRGKHPNSKTTQFKPVFAKLIDRFEAHYISEPNSGCWLWLGNLDNKGYGRYYANKKTNLAHRFAWQFFNGRRTRKFILHKCDTPCCVNPEHLYAGTQAENVRDCVIRNRRRPPKGEANHRTKLTTKQILAIRADPRLQSQIAKAYSMSQSGISLIKTKQNWKHV